MIFTRAVNAFGKIECSARDIFQKVVKKIGNLVLNFVHGGTLQASARNVFSSNGRSIQSSLLLFCDVIMLSTFFIISRNASVLSKPSLSNPLNSYH